jgi:hypothetical protein
LLALHEVNLNGDAVGFQSLLKRVIQSDPGRVLLAPGCDDYDLERSAVELGRKSVEHPLRVARIDSRDIDPDRSVDALN